MKHLSEGLINIHKNYKNTNKTLYDLEEGDIMYYCTQAKPEISKLTVVSIEINKSYTINYKWENGNESFLRLPLSLKKSDIDNYEKIYKLSLTSSFSVDVDDYRIIFTNTFGKYFYTTSEKRAKELIKRL